MEKVVVQFSRINLVTNNKQDEQIKKGKLMKMLLDTILDIAEVNIEDAKKTVKEAVLQEDCDAKCIKISKGYSIKSGRKRLGKGPTEELAWEDAIIDILSFYKTTR